MSTSDGRLRASDAEREDAIESLSDAVAAGRLTLEEYSERSGSVLGARTQGELAALTADVPAASSALAQAISIAPQSASQQGLAVLIGGILGRVVEPAKPGPGDDNGENSPETI